METKETLLQTIDKCFEGFALKGPSDVRYCLRKVEKELGKLNLSITHVNHRTDWDTLFEINAVKFELSIFLSNGIDNHFLNRKHSVVKELVLPGTEHAPAYMDNYKSVSSFDYQDEK